MEIKQPTGDKYVCIKDYRSNELIGYRINPLIINKGDVVNVVKVYTLYGEFLHDGLEIENYIGTLPLTEQNRDYFMPLAEWRDMKINEILE